MTIMNRNQENAMLEIVLILLTIQTTVLIFLNL